VSIVIGVISRVDEVPIVEEFFELFKTPWEFYRPRQVYDVVLATTNDIPEVKARLIIVYGSDTKNTDAENGILVHSLSRNSYLRYRGILLPVYGASLAFETGTAGVLCLTTDSRIVGLRIGSPNSTLLRIGYDLFREVRLLLTEGQPLESAHIPTLDLHVAMLRDWILDAGIRLLEIPPAPAGHDFVVCLTHDIDFVGIRNHKFDHSMWGFLYRSSIGAIRNLFRRRISLTRLFNIWRAAVLLPFVYLGWAKDFWEPFDWYLRVEKNLPSTYFLIPFKNRRGERLASPNGSRRATAYDITDLPHWTTILRKEGCELGVHGIDSWHSMEKGREELARIEEVTGEPKIGVRMHWLLQDQNTFRILEEAGYSYDASAGYNDTIGYRNGTTQPFRPSGAQTLLELPLHIQDGALFYPQKLDLSEPEAWERCGILIDNARMWGGVLTVLWHDRSHGPERFWGDFYVRLVRELRYLNTWFGTAVQVVGWFRKRREIRFEQVEAADGVIQTCVRYNGEEILPPVNIRVHRPHSGSHDRELRGQTTSNFVDIPWTGETKGDLDRLFQEVSGGSTNLYCPEASIEDYGSMDPKGYSNR
jgi:hypothetical protein